MASSVDGLAGAARRKQICIVVDGHGEIDIASRSPARPLPAGGKTPQEARTDWRDHHVF
jgi:hypothetical protein